MRSASRVSPAALGLVETSMPEVALLDMGLPVMNGYELARALWSTPGEPSFSTPSRWMYRRCRAAAKRPTAPQANDEHFDGDPARIVAWDRGRTPLAGMAPPLVDRAGGVTVDVGRSAPWYTQGRGGTRRGKAVRP